ncbi:hypothetical protein BGX30_008301 [Mortierella sp. GBA39]|nr:hypothetical protein BGX30_008301 [Mortierella sp. GBA39]
MLPYTTVHSIFMTFQNTNRASNLPKGGNWGSYLEKEHLEYLMARLLDDRDIPITDLHCHLNKHFRLKPPVSRSTVQNAVNNRIGYSLKLNHLEPVNYNDPDRAQARKDLGRNWRTSAPTLSTISYAWIQFAYPSDVWP